MSRSYHVWFTCWWYPICPAAAERGGWGGRNCFIVRTQQCLFSSTPQAEEDSLRYVLPVLGWKRGTTMWGRWPRLQSSSSSPTTRSTWPAWSWLVQLTSKQNWVSPICSTRYVCGIWPTVFCSLHSMALIHVDVPLWIGLMVIIYTCIPAYNSSTKQL